MAIPIHRDLDFRDEARILNLPAPVDVDEPARLRDLNSAIEGLAPKDSVRVSTQSNINLASPGATIDGITMVSLDRVLVRAQTSTLANGIYLWNGAASAMTRSADCSTAAELEQAVTTAEEGTDAGVTFRQTSVNFTLETDPVAWVTFGTAAPSASETTAGIAEIATQAETDTGTDDARIVTPLKLATWAGRMRKAVADIGDGSATQYDLTHTLGSRDVLVLVRRNASPWDYIIVETQALSTTVVRVIFATAPTTNQFRVIVLG